MRASTELPVLLSCGELVDLRWGAYRARIAPEAGGRVASLAWCGAGERVELLVPWDGSGFEEHAWPKAGAFPMLPFANRLPAQGFRSGSRVVRPDAAPNGVVQHGVAHRRPWRRVEATPERVRMRLEQDGARGWPWAWSAELDVALGDEGMTVQMRVRNEASEPMPLGMGWHPYHPADRGIAPRDLAFDAAVRHELDGAAKASEVPMSPCFGMRPGETAAFAGWSGRATLRGPHGRILAGADTHHVVLHRPASGDYVCIEPVTVLPGHLGEEAAARAHGVLQPGQARQLTWTCGFAPGA